MGKESFIKFRISEDNKLRIKQEAEERGYKGISDYVTECISIGRRYHVSKEMVDNVVDPIDSICGFKI
jgi:hypothetical protein